MFESDRPSWQNPRVLAILLVVFLCGSVCGALTMRYGLHERLHKAGPSPGISIDPVMSYDRLSGELNLNSQQRQQLKTILDDYARYHEDLQVQLEDWRATGKNQIIRILDPSQRERFEKLCSEIHYR
jgi:hypothetical protein